MNFSEALDGEDEEFALAFPRLTTLIVSFCFFLFLMNFVLSLSLLHFTKMFAFLTSYLYIFSRYSTIVLFIFSTTTLSELNLFIKVKSIFKLILTYVKLVRVISVTISISYYATSKVNFGCSAIFMKKLKSVVLRAKYSEVGYIKFVLFLAVCIACFSWLMNKVLK